jgi:hypothetical protein
MNTFVPLQEIEYMDEKIAWEVNRLRRTLLMGVHNLLYILTLLNAPYAMKGMQMLIVDIDKSRIESILVQNTVTMMRNGLLCVPGTPVVLICMQNHRVSESTILYYERWSSYGNFKVYNDDKIAELYQQAIDKCRSDRLPQIITNGETHHFRAVIEECIRFTESRCLCREERNELTVYVDKQINQTRLRELFGYISQILQNTATTTELFE